MPRCYFLAVSNGSSLDHFTNNWSLFGLVGRIALEGEEAPTVESPILAPLEVLTFWRFSQEELNTAFEWRLVATVAGSDLNCSREFSIKPEKKEMRHRVKGLSIVAAGESELRVECRKKGSQVWERAEAVWLLKVLFTQKSATTKSLNLPQGE